jgi:hypothetical protein
MHAMGVSRKLGQLRGRALLLRLPALGLLTSSRNDPVA